MFLGHVGLASVDRALDKRSKNAGHADREVQASDHALDFGRKRTFSASRRHQDIRGRRQDVSASSTIFSLLLNNAIF